MEGGANLKDKASSLGKRKAEKGRYSEDQSRKKRNSKKERAKVLLAGLTQEADCPSLHELRKERHERERQERRKSHDLLCK